MNHPPEDFSTKKITPDSTPRIASGVTPEDTLRLLANANPPAGLAERVEARLASMQAMEPDRARRNRGPFFFLTAYPRTVAASLVGCILLAGGIGFYRVHRSAALPPPIRMNSGGMGAAGAIRVAPAGVAAPTTVPPRTAPKNVHGRAVIQAGRKPRPKGVAVPNTPPPAEKDTAPEQ